MSETPSAAAAQAADPSAQWEVAKRAAGDAIVSVGVVGVFSSVEL